MAQDPRHRAMSSSLKGGGTAAQMFRDDWPERKEMEVQHMQQEGRTVVLDTLKGVRRVSPHASREATSSHSHSSFFLREESEINMWRQRVTRSSYSLSSCLGQDTRIHN